jgi:leucyl/phenylalanyl-tRNA--protein transferase
MELSWIDGDNPVFPHPSKALADPEGLLAVGGNLNATTLLTAYKNGIFPWFEENQPILWWSPANRAVLKPGQARIGKTLLKILRTCEFRLSTNTTFDEVITACAAPRAKARGTWITPEMISAYRELHSRGHAHSLECWHEDKLVGGLYGVQVGALFCGESMFSRASNASKIAFIGLSQALAIKGFRLIDCQLENPHLTSLGVKIMPRPDFLEILAQSADQRIHWPQSTDFNSAISSFKERPQ